MMKKLICCFSMALSLGLLSSCVDKNEEVDADSKPGWLNGSIYSTLQNPSSGGLQGTFSTYLKLVDDLGYAETLNRTGSKTVFPANDEAFTRFFQSNKWGVTSYEQLSEAQKKLLFYNSMLDNALLTSMLSNVPNGSNATQNGFALKHATNSSVTDSITYIYGVAQMPANNKYWAKHSQGLNVVYDNTTPMMVHFTREQMVNNEITISGDDSDFEILTGSKYDDSDAENSNVFVFDDKVIKPNVTCQNGYIHQVENVLMPPGNMAQVIRENTDASLFSRVLDYFSAPYYSATTTNTYNDWAVQNGKATIDSIFSVNYLSDNTKGASLNTDPDGNLVTSILSFDPGWNEYYVRPTKTSAITDAVKLANIGVMFVPTDDAMKSYFLPGGDGAYLIDIYGAKENTAANLAENLDTMHVKNPQVLTAFVRNLQKSSFVSTVPSKFTTINNDAAENMGMNVGLLLADATGKKKYDVRVANNGVIYMLNSMVAPDEYSAVLAPCSSYPDMAVMNWAVQDGVSSTHSVLGIDFKYYLLAMSSNYAFFIPDDQSFDLANASNACEYASHSEGELFYVDPTSLETRQPRALLFSYDTKAGKLVCKAYNYNKSTNTLGAAIAGTIDISSVKTQLVDILNYHTLVLDQGETIGNNHYYKTKHGGEIYVTGGNEGNTVYSGSQIDNGLTPATIEHDFSEKNGHSYRLHGIIQPPHNSVRTTLENYNERFSEFTELCIGFSGAESIMSWAGISSVKNSFGTAPQDRYTIFTTTYGSGNNAVQNACLGEGNVKFFNTYNYTLYAPNNEAMQKAYAAGLPKWSDIEALYDKYTDHDVNDKGEVTYGSAEEKADAELAYSYISAIREFIRYHFQSVSVYADNTVEGGSYATMHTDEVGVSENITLQNLDGARFSVTDGQGNTQTIDANGTLLTNKMARDYWFASTRSTINNSITTSSFCAVHEISTPLYSASDSYKDTASKELRYDLWNKDGKASLAKAVSHYKRIISNSNN